MEVEELTVIEAAAAMRKGGLTAAMYSEALLGRAESAAALNAFVRLDPAVVRRAAARADEHRKLGRPLGPLHGVPLALKDNLDTAEFPTTGGTPGLKHNCPKRNAPVVQSLLDAGAIVLGKANMHELAYGVTNNNAAFQPARNPYDMSRIPGGSSGGTAVAVSARLAPAGIGSDTGGSVRIPAALCGVVGFRPTTGRWSQADIVPISHTRDTAGPLARTVADCALIDAVVTGGSAELEPVTVKGLRLGVPRGHFWQDLDAELGRILEGTLDRLRDAGVELIEGDVADVRELDAAAGFPIALYETVTDLDTYLREHEAGLDYAGLVALVASPDVSGILSSLIGGGAVPEAAYREALTIKRPALQETFRRCFRDHDTAAILFPTTPMPAAKIGEDETVLVNGAVVPTFQTYIRNTGPGSVAGIPGLTLPAGLTLAGLPVGIELDGPAGADHRVLSIGLEIEKLLPKTPAPKI